MLQPLRSTLLRRAPAASSSFLNSTAALSSSFASPSATAVTSSIAPVFIRSLHTSSSLTHNHSDWPHRSHSYFHQQTKLREEAEAKEAQVAVENALPYTRVDHAHPVPSDGKGPQYFSVFRFRNEQYKAVVDDVIMMNLIDGEVGDVLTSDDVLVLGGRDASLIGRPAIAGARVTMQIEEHTHTAKVIVFKKKRRKGFQKKQGHRQEISLVRILSIETPQDIEPLTRVAASSTAQTIDAKSAEVATKIPIATVPRVKLTKPAAESTSSDASSSTPSKSTGVKKSPPLATLERLRAERPMRKAAFKAERAKLAQQTGGARAYSTFARTRLSFLSRVAISPRLSSSFHSSSTLTDSSAEPQQLATNEATIDSLLRRDLNASTLQIEDTSGGCGAFFRLLVVSPKFTGLSLVKQHRLVNQTLKPHIANLHGLTLTTYTEEQWNNKAKAN